MNIGFMSCCGNLIMIKREKYVGDLICFLTGDQKYLSEEYVCNIKHDGGELRGWRKGVW